MDKFLTHNCITGRPFTSRRTITNSSALSLITSHYNNTHDMRGVSLINFYAEMGARQEYYRQAVLDWLGY